MVKKATRDQTKHHNSRLILKTIYDLAPISRAAVARSTHLTRPTISSQVLELINAGLVAEVGLGSSRGGKPPTLLNIDSNARHLICVEIGTQTFKGALTNLRGEIVHSLTLPAQQVKGPHAITLLHSLIDQLQAATQSPILGIGIGTPGLVDPAEGVIHRALGFDWTNVPLRQILAEKYPYPIYIANDAQAAALAEFMFGSAKKSQNVVVIKVGEGIGAGIVLNGIVLNGDGFGAGEIGQVVVTEQDGKLRSLESVANVQAILQEAKRTYKVKPNWETIINDNSPEITRLFEQMGHYLGISVANLISIINIQNIIISGPIVQIGEPLLKSIRRTARQYTLSTMIDETTIVYSSLGSDIVLLGCSALILKHELGVL